MPGVTALQLSPFSASLEQGLAQRFELIRWFELDDAAKQALLADRAGSIGAVVTSGSHGCPNALIDALPALGIIAVHGVGVDQIDLDHARGRGVRVTSTPDVLTDDVADLAVGLIIALLRGIPSADAFVRSGDWTRGSYPLARKVSGRRFGIVGLGRIGEAIAHRLAPFGPLAYTGRRPKDVPFAFEPDLLALARDSDVLVIATAATPDTERLVDADVLAALGRDGYLVNIARGSIVDEAALIEALAKGDLAGAALDVFDNEPDIAPALVESERVVLTPHVGSATVETRAAMAQLVLDNLDAFLAGTPLPTPVD